MKTSGNDTEKYKRAKKKVAEIKGFYTHLTIYILVNTFILLTASGLLSGNILSLEMPEWPHFISPVAWGVGLLFHVLSNPEQLVYSGYSTVSSSENNNI